VRKLITYFSLEQKILYLQSHTTFDSDKHFQLVHIKQEGTVGGKRYILTFDMIYLIAIG